jgi:hypothetical protein
MRANHLIVLVLVAACGSSSTPKPDAAQNGFTPPAAPLTAYDNSGTMPVMVDADFTSCTAIGMTTVAVAVSTTVKDFQSHNAVPNAMVTAFPGVSTQQTFATGTSDASGNLVMTIPPGTGLFGFEMTTTDGTTMPTFLLNQSLDTDPAMTAQTISKIQSVSVATAETLPALIGETRTPGTGVVAGALRDCQDHELANFAATVSSTSGTATPIDGAETYYFTPGVDLPVRNTQEPSSSADGLFMVVQLPVAQTAYVQMWGYEDMASVGGPMKLIAELQVPVLADTVITGDYQPAAQ